MTSQHPDYQALWQMQEGKCAICREDTGELFVDHDHKSGFVRGLLCPACNTGIGMFRDKVHLLEAAVEYLRTPRFLDRGVPYHVIVQTRPKRPDKPRTRGNGEGSIRKRSDGRWEARLLLDDGRMKSVYAKTRREVVAKLIELLNKRDQDQRKGGVA